MSSQHTQRTVPIPNNRPSRQQLLFEFDLQRDVAIKDEFAFQYFICDAYPPCTRPMDQLQSINIADLDVGTRHHGRILIIRNIESPVRLAAIQTIVEDEAGHAARLSVYNSSPTLSAEALLPENAVFAIKEPFYWTDTNGATTLRVDHPSDLIWLSPSDEIIPLTLVSDSDDVPQSAADWKVKGNEEYGNQHFLEAYRAYTCGLKVCALTDLAVKQDMFRNRAVANLFLRHYVQAFSDAEAAIIVTTDALNEKQIALNIKAYERKAIAAYELGNLETAKICYQQIQDLDSTHADASKNLKRIVERLHESSSGKYDFDRVSRSASKRNNRLDFASYTGFPRVMDAKNHGRGLFAVEDIEAGQLVLVEKALNVAFDTDNVPKSYAILDQKAKRGLIGSQAILLFGLIEKSLNNIETATELLKLYAGCDYPDVPIQELDGCIPIDTFRVMGIVEHNSFECPSVRSSTHQDSGSSADPRSTGLWLKAAYINHACDGNVMRSFMGDFIIIRAARSIKGGEEILMSYQTPDAINSITQEKLQKTWGFKCDCRICVAEATSAFKTRRARSQLIERSRTLLKDFASPSKPMDRKSSIQQAENLLAKLKATYEEDVFACKPRLGLVPLGFWLCQAHSSSKSYDQVVKVAMEVLRDLGFLVHMDEKMVSIDRSNCQLDGTAMDVGMYAAHALRQRKKFQLATQFQCFAQSLYLIMYGELRGFNERYNAQLIPETSKN